MMSAMPNVSLESPTFQFRIRVRALQDFDLIGQERDVRRLYHEMLGQLFDVVAVAVPLQNEAGVPEQHAKFIHPPGQPTPHRFFQLVNVGVFHASSPSIHLVERTSARNDPSSSLRHNLDPGADE
jgi:hypothetical protein